VLLLSRPHANWRLRVGDSAEGAGSGIEPFLRVVTPSGSGR